MASSPTERKHQEPAKRQHQDLVPRIGAFGEYGGRYVPELLVPALVELERARKEIVPSRDFKKALTALLDRVGGAPYASGRARLGFPKHVSSTSS